MLCKNNCFDKVLTIFFSLIYYLNGNQNSYTVDDVHGGNKKQDNEISPINDFEVLSYHI